MSKQYPVKGWRVKYNPKPIPTTEHDWDLWHIDYDGPGDIRADTAGSKEEAIAKTHSLDAQYWEDWKESHRFLWCRDN